VPRMPEPLNLTSDAVTRWPRAAPCHDDAEVEALIAGLAREERGGLLVLPENFNIVHRDVIITLAARYRLPAVYPYRFFTAIGGLMSYGIDPDGRMRTSPSARACRRAIAIYCACCCLSDCGAG
jgi:hypothetical protein